MLRGGDLLNANGRMPRHGKANRPDSRNNITHIIANGAEKNHIKRIYFVFDSTILREESPGACSGEGLRILGLLIDKNRGTRGVSPDVDLAGLRRLGREAPGL
jgi:hypothetical protein